MRRNSIHERKRIIALIREYSYSALSRRLAAFNIVSRIKADTVSPPASAPRRIVSQDSSSITEIPHRRCASGRTARPTFRSLFLHGGSLRPCKKFVNNLDKRLDVIAISLYIKRLDVNDSVLYREKTMEPREQRGFVIAATARGIKRKSDHLWTVPSTQGAGHPCYHVNPGKENLHLPRPSRGRAFLQAPLRGEVRDTTRIPVRRRNRHHHRNRNDGDADGQENNLPAKLAGL